MRQLFSSLMVLLFICAPNAFAKGAFAISTWLSNDKVMWAMHSVYNKPTKTIAEEMVLKECAQKAEAKCTIVKGKTFDNGCWAGAFSFDGQNYAIERSNTRARAEKEAMDKCSKDAGLRGETCSLRRSFCDTTGGFKPADASGKPVEWDLPFDAPIFCKNALNYKACLKTKPSGYGPESDLKYFCRMSFC